MRLFLALLTTLLMAACATNPVTGKRELSFMSEAQEIRWGGSSMARCGRRWASTKTTSCSNTFRTSACGWRSDRSGRTCRGTSRCSIRRPSTPSRCPAATSTSRAASWRISTTKRSSPASSGTRSAT